MLSILLATALFVPQDSTAAKSPPETQSSALTAALTTNENLRTKLADQQNDNFWSVVKAVGVTLAAAVPTLGAAAFGAAKWYADARGKAKDAEHKQNLETLQTEAAIKAAEQKASLESQLALAKATAENKKTENDDKLSRITEDLKRLEAQCKEDEQRCREELSALRTDLNQEVATTKELRNQLNRQHDQLVYMQISSADDPFMSIAVDTGDVVLAVSAAAELNILAPMKSSRSDFMGRSIFDVVPAPFAATLKVLWDKAFGNPNHTSTARDVVIHENVQPMLISCTAWRYPDRRPGGVKIVAIPMSAFVELPKGISDAKTPTKGTP